MGGGISGRRTALAKGLEKASSCTAGSCDYLLALGASGTKSKFLGEALARP